MPAVYMSDVVGGLWALFTTGICPVKPKISQYREAQYYLYEVDPKGKDGKSEKKDWKLASQKKFP